MLRGLLVRDRREWPLQGRRFHALERRADHGGGKDRDRVALPRFMERWDRRFGLSSARACAAPDRCASSCPLF